MEMATVVLQLSEAAITENYNSVFWNTNSIENKTQVRQMVDLHTSKRVLINIGIFK